MATLALKNDASQTDARPPPHCSGSPHPRRAGGPPYAPAPLMGPRAAAPAADPDSRQRWSDTAAPSIESTTANDDRNQEPPTMERQPPPLLLTSKPERHPPPCCHGAKLRALLLTSRARPPTMTPAALLLTSKPERHPPPLLSYIIYNKAPPPVVFICRYLQENGKYNCK